MILNLAACGGLPEDGATGVYRCPTDPPPTCGELAKATTLGTLEHARDTCLVRLKSYGNGWYDCETKDE